MGKFFRGADNNKAALDPKRAGSQGAAAHHSVAGAMVLESTLARYSRVTSRDSAAGEDWCVRVTLRTLNADSDHWHGDGGPAHFQ